MIHYDLTYEQYEALPGWRWSHIKAMERSPRAVRYEQSTSGDTASRVVLRAIHHLVLEPGSFGDHYALCDVVRNRKHAKYQAWLAENAGRVALTAKEWSEVVDVAASYREHAGCAAVLASGRPEVTVTWTDEATGLALKARIDWLDPDRRLLADLKTYGTVESRQVAGRVAQLGADGQMAHYAAGLAANGIIVKEAALLVAQGKAEHDAAVYILDYGVPDGALHVGEQYRRRYLDRLAECVERDEWPGAHPEPVALALPAWRLTDTVDDLEFDDE